MVNRKKISHFCIFCKTKENDVLNLGEMMRTKNIYAHYFCVLLSAHLPQRGTDTQGIWGFLYSDILSSVKSNAKFICSFCKKKGANIHCDYKRCQVKFHLPCGIQRDCLSVFANRYQSYCPKHNSHNIPSKMRLGLKQYECAICYESFEQGENLYQTIFGNCCKRHMYHKQCLREYANSAGYFTHCPMCKSQQPFVRCLQKFGVFVPERDASWELVDQAYAELETVPPDTCTGEPCVSLHGPKYNKRNSGWRIHCCCSCGKNGIHAKCSPAKDRYICPTCNLDQSTHLKDDMQNRHPSIIKVPFILLTKCDVDVHSNTRKRRITSNKCFVCGPNCEAFRQ